MKTTKLKAPRRVRIRGKSFWQVEAPAPGGGRIRKTFREREDARIYHERAKVAVHQFGSASMGMDEKARADAVRALAILEPHGATLLDAAKEFAARAEALKGGKPLAKAVADFLAAQEGKGLSARYLTDLRARLQRFTAAHPKATTATITAEAINKFLRAEAPHPVTANNFRRCLSAFFSWCKKGKLSPGNPAAEADKAKECKDDPATITDEQFAALLENAEARIRPAIALAGFCALRQAEIARLDWSKIDLKERVVSLDARTTKTNSRRTVMIPLAAVAWLAPLAKKSGPVLTHDAETRAAWDLARLAAGFGPFKTQLMRSREAQAKMTKEQLKALQPWPDNALRHTAISARIALSAEDAAKAFDIAPEVTLSVTDIAAVAYQAGNSPQVIRAHYLRLSKPEAARKWFAVTPPAEAGNVVQMRKQA